MRNELMILDKASAAIARVSTVGEAKKIADEAAAIKVLAAKQGWGHREKAKIGEIEIRATVKMGELLAKMEKAKGKRTDLVPDGNHVGKSTLADLNVTKKQSHVAQKSNAVPSEQREEYLRETVKAGRVPTVTGLIHVARRKESSLNPIPAPKGKYAVIYADPPWDIGSMVLDKWESPLEEKYPTMTLNELKNLKIEDLSMDDCACFMWTTLSMLPSALELLHDWGFKYHITLTWDKGGGWSANGFHRRTELVLVGYKGALSKVIKQKGSYIPTIFHEKKTKHSAKPSIMRRYIEERTIGEKIELFARGKQEKGWTVWGNEAGV